MELYSYSAFYGVLNTYLPFHRDKDELTPYYMRKQLFEKYQGTKQMITIKGGGHNDLQETDSTQYWGGIDRFLKE